MLTSIHLDSWTVQILGEDNPRDIEQASWYMAIEYLCYAADIILGFSTPITDPSSETLSNGIRNLHLHFQTLHLNWLVEDTSAVVPFYNESDAPHNSELSNNAVPADTSTELEKSTD